MAILHIYVAGKQSEELAEIGIRALVKTPDGTGEVQGIGPITADRASASITLAYVPEPPEEGEEATPEKGVFEQAYDYIKAHPYVATINGRRPSRDGSFWLFGDPCVAWLPEGQDDVPTAEGEDRSRMGSSVTLLGMCAPCSSCDTVVRLRRQLEWIKMAINTLKDVNLYDDDTCGARSDYLEASRTPVPVNCSVAGYEKYNDPYLVPSKRLLGQYVTMVHMWNYAVAQNNSCTEIHSAPEDPAGFYVQTKRALPSCGGHATVNVTVEITQVYGQSGLSAFMPDPVTSFKPHQFNADVSGHEWTKTEKFDGVGPKKTVTTTFQPATVAGTYLLTVKFLPFMPVTVTVNGVPQQFAMSSFNWGIYSESDATASAVVSDVDASSAVTTSTVTLPGTAVGLGDAVSLPAAVSSRIEAPTSTQYNDAKTYPSYSNAAVKNRWLIKVAWTLQWPTAPGQTGTNFNPNGETHEETYYFETNAVRQYLDGVLKPSDLAKVMIPT